MNKYSMKCEKCGKDFQATENTFNKIKNKSRPCYCKICYDNHIMDTTFVECKCEKCGKIFQISKRNFHQRRYKGRANLCGRCMDSHTKQNASEAIKMGLLNMSPDKKKAMMYKQSNAAKRRYENMSSEEKDEMKKRLNSLSKSYHQYLSSLPEEDRQKIFATWGYNALTDEQKKIRNQKISVKTKSRFDNMTEEDMDYIVQNLRSHLANYLENETDEQRNERLSKISEGMKRYYANLSEEEMNKRRDDLANIISDYLQNETEEQKRARFSKSGKTRHDNYLNESPEERQARSDRTKRQWENISEEDKKILLQPMFDGYTKWSLSLSEDERLELYRISTNNIHLYYKNESEEDRAARIQKLSKSVSDSWSKLSPEEKELKMYYLREGWREWFDNLSEEDKERRSYERSVKEQERWDNLPDERKIELLRARLLTTPSKCSNNLNKRFVDAFNHSILKGSFSLIPEYATSNMTTHLWDYAIYQGDSLVMVVDLDGAYFHADRCDYDGIHSKEEYDEKRSMSVPDKVKISIINELSFRKTFQELVRNIITDYDDYIDYLFRQYRSMPFPDPHYTSVELIHSFQGLEKMNCDDKYHKNISLNTRIGDRLIQHFHHSIYHAHIKGKPSPYEAWYDDELLRKCIENRILYQSYLNRNKILQGFNVSKIATKVSVFSAGRAKLIINRYLNEYDTIFDPFSGFSGRMLGAISLGKKYIGQDINEIHVNESNDMIQFLKKFFSIDAYIATQDTKYSSGEYPCLFTCPPYGNKEIWTGDITSDLSCDEWIDICLKNFKCQKYVFVVDYTEKYMDHVVDVIHNKSHYNHNDEYIIYID